MKKQVKSAGFWILALLLAILVGVFQRMTGPTYPVNGEEILGETRVSYHLPRSHTEFQGLPVSVDISAESGRAVLSYRRYPTDEPWKDIEMTRENGTWTALVPGQPKAGKVEYMVRYESDASTYLINDGESIVARFKGRVPAGLLIAHVLFMFLAIVFGLRAGMEALRPKGQTGWMVSATLLFVLVGGLILGPLVQKYAFGQLWTGFPFGFDLTDNKTLLIFIFWLFAFLLRKRGRWWVVLATVLMLIVYLIPHSVLGSELDYSTGELMNVYSMVHRR